MDSAIKMAQMPKPGETIMGGGVSLIPGGKGANQAYAAGKLGGKVAMLGAVGDDAFGDKLIENLEKVDVNTKGVIRCPEVSTGQAFISINEEGQNSIVVIAGANEKVSREVIDANMALIDEADIIIMQLEIPIATVEYAKEVAKEKGKTIIVDPAPAVAGLPDSFWDGIDYIKPNETELEILLGRSAVTEEEIYEGAKEFLAKGVKSVIVTLGAKGCLYVTSEGKQLFPTAKVNAIDTTAAGDSFTAAFALALSQGENVTEAIRYGQMVSGIVVTREGAQTSIPSKEEMAYDVKEAIDITDIDYSEYGILYNMSGNGNSTGNTEHSCGNGWDNNNTICPIMDTLTKLGYTWSTKQPFLAEAMEKHADTQEVQLPIDQPIVFCLAKAGKRILRAEDVIPVILRPGYMFVIHRDVWHTASHGVEKDGYYYWMSNSEEAVPWQDIEGDPVFVKVKENK